MALQVLISFQCQEVFGGNFCPDDWGCLKLGVYVQTVLNSERINAGVVCDKTDELNTQITVPVSIIFFSHSEELKIK